MGELLENIQNAAQNTQAGDINLIAFANNPIISKLLFYFKIAFYMAVCAAIIWVIWKLFLQYKVRITLYRRIGGGGLETIQERARIVTDKDGKTKLELLKTRHGKIRVTAPIPAAKYRSKIGKSDHYAMFIDDNYQLHSITTPQINQNELFFKVIPEERKAWSRQERRQVETQYKNAGFLDKYMPSMIVLSAFMIAFLIFFFMSKDLAASLTSLTGQFQNVAESCLKLA